MLLEIRWNDYYSLTVDYYVLSAPDILPEFSTVKQYERYKYKLYNMAANLIYSTMRRVKSSKCSVNGRKLPTETRHRS